MSEQIKIHGTAGNMAKLKEYVANQTLLWSGLFAENIENIDLSAKSIIYTDELGKNLIDKYEEIAASSTAEGMECKSCHSTDTVYGGKQTRSGDEAETYSIRCNNCKARTYL